MIKPVQHERRLHKVFLTKNTEYHVRGDTCIGVRDRRSGQWLMDHLAVHARVHGSLRFNKAGGITPSPGAPQIGESLFLDSAGQDVVTSTIIDIQRPGPGIVAQYAA